MSAAAPLAASATRVHAGGLDWFVSERGARGPVLLLLHGTGASHHSWLAIAHRLERDFRLVMPDLPGHGATRAPNSSCLTLSGMAAAVTALITTLGLRPNGIVGHSAGAAIALVMCREPSARTRSTAIIGINAALKPFGGMAGLIFAPLARLLTATSFAAPFFAAQASSRRRVVDTLEGTGSKLDDAAVDAYQALFRDSRHVQSALTMMANWDLAPLVADMPAITAPITLIATAGDRAVPPEQAYDAAERLPAARVVYLRKGGHLAHEEYPDEIADLVRAALADPPIRRQ